MLRKHNLILYNKNPYPLENRITTKFYLIKTQNFQAKKKLYKVKLCLGNTTLFYITFFLILKFYRGLLKIILIILIFFNFRFDLLKNLTLIFILKTCHVFVNPYII